jgi:phospholipid/cholesterol/gamma-HCH transport system substrate-binding protein
VNVKVTPEFEARSLAFRAGLFVVVALIGLLFLTFKAQTGMPFAKTTKVTAVVDNVHSLRTNDAVRQNSKRIGRVSKLEYEDGKAIVTMSLDGTVEVYKNAHAAVWDLSALATKFVELDPGTPDAGGLDASAIPSTQTDDSADLYQVLDVLDPKTRAGATSTLREVGGGASGHGADLAAFLGRAPDILGDLGDVSQSLAAPEADLPALLDQTDQLASRFSGRESEIDALVTQTDSTLKAIAIEDGRPLQETIERLPETLTTTKRSMDSLRDPLTQTGAAMTALEPGARSLSASEKDLRGFLRDAVPVAAKVPGVAKKAKPAVSDLTRTMSDARPLAPKLRQTIGDLMTPLSVLAPYSTDMSQLFERGASFVSQGPNPGTRYARLGLTPGANTVTGGLFGSSNLPQNEYPRPGEAQHDRAGGALPTGLLPGGN